MVATRRYARLRDRVQRLIDAEPATVTFYTRGNDSWTATGRLAPAGSRSFGRTMQTMLLAGTEVVGRQLSVLLVPYDTRVPGVNDEVRTIRGELEQRFTVVFTIASPYVLEVLLDESG